MKSAFAATALLISAASASPLNITSRSSNAGTSLPGLPSGCMTSYNGIAWGWLPDDEVSSATMAQLNADTGKKGCFFGDYSHISSTSYDGSDITGKAGKTAGAIMVPSIMPDGVTWDQIDSSLAAKIGNVVKAFTSKGITTYLRFAHEMNCYAKPGCANPAYPGGQDYAAFKKAWINVANVCRGISGCYMFWCPNLQDLSTLSNWFPGADYVDIIGVDHYPGDSDISAGFSSNYASFYNQFVKPYNKPFLLGETASGSSLSVKNSWVKATTMSDFSNFPLYKGAMWFEYNKEANFYVVLNQNKNQVNAFDANFA